MNFDQSETNKKIAALEAQKNDAYAQRNKLVALATKVFPAYLGMHVGEPWEDDWRHIVFIELPKVGQITFHIHDSELPMFEHLMLNPKAVWDGHSDEEKWKRVAKFK